MQKHFPAIRLNVRLANAEAFSHCLPVLEGLAKKWPEPFAALKLIEASPDREGA